MTTLTANDPAAWAQNKNEIYPLPRPTSGPKTYRLEIDELLADKAMTNLFLLALSEMQGHSIKYANSDTPNYWSFYSIAAIHGLPREDWPGPGYSNNSGYGYCHHGMSTFPTWHRPYMFQMEQAVYNQMIVKANEFKNQYKQIYLDAAARFRLPYWDIAMPRHSDDSQASDWARKQGIWRWGLPEIVKRAEVYVRMPDAPEDLVPMKNPLYTFRFPKKEEYAKLKDRPQIPWEMTGLVPGFDREHPPTEKQKETTPQFSHTVRGPTSKVGGDSDYQYLDEAVQAQTREMTLYIWQLLNPETELDPKTKKLIDNQIRPWNTFANHFLSREPRVSNDPNRSLESWHDSIHGLIGTGQGSRGHMGNPAVAAFDPLFWLHHNNIERLLCLYQVLYPNSYVPPGKQKDQNPPVKPNDPDLFADDQLYPFTKDSSKKQCYTSTDIRDWTKSGFAVPGDQNLGEAGQKAVKQYLRDTYRWATDRNGVPPPSLQYPKELEHVEALTGEKGTTVKKSMVQMQAISVQDGVPALVARTIAVEAGVKPRDDFQDPKIVANILKDEEKDFPEGTLIDVDKESDTKMNTWNALFQIKKYTYDESFNIHFFMGDIDHANPQNFMIRKNEVGFSGIFVQPESAECNTCELNRKRGIMYQDVVPLTNLLTDYLDNAPGSGNLIGGDGKTTIRDLSAEEVVPFLKQHLRWRITDTSSQLLQYLPESELEIKVAARMYVLPQGDNLLGTYGPSTVYPEITSGKEGGYSGPA